jgi:tetraacyldisaccharide 4'-kinase
VTPAGTGARLVRGWQTGFGRGTSALLSAVGGGYRGLLAARELLYASGVLRARAVGCPVVSVGNLTVGGAGKTPAVELAVLTLKELGLRPAVVSRGYGRRTRGLQVVADTASIRLDPEEGGDEPFLLGRRLPGVPVIVGANRHQAAQLAVERYGVSAIVLDDGFQHRTLRKDLEIVMARAGAPWGNGRLFPAGPLREPLAALRRAHLVVATGARGPADAAAVEAAVARHAPGVPVLAAAYVPIESWDARAMRPVPVEMLRGQRLLAFAGIGSPSGFAATLAEVGVDSVEMTVFADHHWYTGRDLTALESRAVAADAAGLVTTEKDWVRLRRLPLPRRPLYVLAVRLALLGGEDTWRRAFEGLCSSA